MVSPQEIHYLDRILENVDTDEGPLYNQYVRAMLDGFEKPQLPFDMLTALSKAEGRRCVASFVIAAYCKYASFPRICAP